MPTMRRAPRDGTTTIEVGTGTDTDMEAIEREAPPIDGGIRALHPQQSLEQLKTRILLTQTRKPAAANTPNNTGTTTTSAAKTLKPPSSSSSSPRSHLLLPPTTTPTALARAPGDLTRTHVAGIIKHEDEDDDDQDAATVLDRGPGDLTRSHVHGIVASARAGAGAVDCPDSSEVRYEGNKQKQKEEEFLLVDQGQGAGVTGTGTGRRGFASDSDSDSRSESESESESETSSSSGSAASSSAASTSDGSTGMSSDRSSPSYCWYHNTTDLTDDMVRQILLEEGREAREQLRRGWRLPRIDDALPHAGLDLAAPAIANQRLEASVAEDRENKPWRPLLPAGPVTQDEAQRLWITLIYLLPVFGKEAVQADLVELASP
ncbi:hypothetical protein F5X96DRAFT_672239 [Biscogniauxia mediterranea]|nr:hypothetical protein F5X96DRAFT_672239 [Biscogniauxia mediterranea]